MLEAKTKGRYFIGLEIQEDVVDMAKRSVKLNRLKEKVEIVHGNIKDASQIFGRSVFDVVTCNPPYMNENHGLKNPELPKAIARHEILCNLVILFQFTYHLVLSFLPCVLTFPTPSIPHWKY